MLSAEDHLMCELPRPALNLDVVRCLAVFESPAAMLTALQTLCLSFGGFCKLKNGMNWSAQEAEGKFYLRTVMVTVEFCHPTLQTIGQLRSCPQVQAAWHAYANLDRESVPSGVSKLQWRLRVQEALQWLNELPEATNVSMLCEIQVSAGWACSERC